MKERAIGSFGIGCRGAPRAEPGDRGMARYCTARMSSSGQPAAWVNEYAKARVNELILHNVASNQVAFHQDTRRRRLPADVPR